MRNHNHLALYRASRTSFAITAMLRRVFSEDLLSICVQFDVAIGRFARGVLVCCSERWVKGGKQGLQFNQEGGKLVDT